MHVRSFPPIAAPTATRLVLGTMPGRMSLAAREYYAHPRNAFWDIMQQLLGIPRELPYRERVQGLQQAGIAVWDVLAACTRTTSLDSDILPASIVPNDFVPFLSTHPNIRRIFFNGNNARRLFERHVLPVLTPRQHQIERVTLPATSPAHARMSRTQKAKEWRAILEE